MESELENKEITEEEAVILGQALWNYHYLCENRQPDMFQDKDLLKGIKSLMKKFELKRSYDETHKIQRFIVRCNEVIVKEYDGIIGNGSAALILAEKMHSLDSGNYYSASVEVTKSPVLIDGGSKEPQEIAIWSSDSVFTEDEFDFEGA